MPTTPTNQVPPIQIELEVLPPLNITNTEGTDNLNNEYNPTDIQIEKIKNNPLSTSADIDIAIRLIKTAQQENQFVAVEYQSLRDQILAETESQNTTSKWCEKKQIFGNLIRMNFANVIINTSPTLPETIVQMLNNEQINLVQLDNQQYIEPTEKLIEQLLNIQKNQMVRLAS